MIQFLIWSDDDCLLPKIHWSSSVTKYEIRNKRLSLLANPSLMHSNWAPFSLFSSQSSELIMFYTKFGRQESYCKFQMSEATARSCGAMNMEVYHTHISCHLGILLLWWKHISICLTCQKDNNKVHVLFIPDSDSNYCKMKSIILIAF